MNQLAQYRKCIIQAVCICLILVFACTSFGQTTDHDLFENITANLEQQLPPGISEKGSHEICLYYANLFKSLEPKQQELIPINTYVEDALAHLLYVMSLFPEQSTIVYHNMREAGLSQDPFFKNLSSPLLNQNDHETLLFQLKSINDLVSKTLTNTLLTKDSILFVSEDSLISNYISSFENIYSQLNTTNSYHDSSSTAHDLFGAHHNLIKANLIRYSIDYILFDTYKQYQFTAQNIFYNGYLAPVSQKQFAQVQKDISASIKETFAGNHFVFEYSTMQQLVDSFFLQLSPLNEEVNIPKNLFDYYSLTSSNGFPNPIK